MDKYQPTIGLEIHAELKTATKMFCDCPNNPEERTPNVNVCPICLGHPGTLPVPNKKAIEGVVRAGLALGGTIASLTKFDRKNYFYPDLPKGYQISQYDQPIVSGGMLNGVRITRIHLEEDAGRLGHVGGSTVVDYNRAGLPLMELVTEPDIRSAQQASDFARELQLVLRYLGISDADMDKGQMRIEANISLNMGTKVEVKNINSFKAVRDAIEYEVKRQIAAIESGEKIVQSTRGWNETKKETVYQRSKEEAHDYRYFPEPDIPPFETSVLSPEMLEKALPELPWQKRERFVKHFGITEESASLLAADRFWADFFEAAVSELAGRDEKEGPAPEKRAQDLLFSYMTSDLRGLMNELKVSNEDLKVNPERLAHLVDLLVEGKIGSHQTKQILRIMVETGDDPEEILQSRGLHTISDEGQLELIARKIVEENPGPAQQYREGKEAVMQFFVGKAMGMTKGQGNPATLKEVFIKVLSS